MTICRFYFRTTYTCVPHSSGLGWAGAPVGRLLGSSRTGLGGIHRVGSETAWPSFPTGCSNRFLETLESACHRVGAGRPAGAIKDLGSMASSPGPLLSSPNSQQPYTPIPTTTLISISTDWIGLLGGAVMAVARHCPSWADLRPELLGLVLRRLPSLADRVRLGAVCRAWLRIAGEEPLPPPLPWLTLLDGTFLNISDGEIHRMRVPEDALTSQMAPWATGSSSGALVASSH
jgi:hypothetical protein